MKQIDTIALAQNLIRQKSVNPPGNEYLVAKVVTSFLDDHGIPYRSIEKTNGRPNIIARVAGRGEAPPLLLYGHMDVVDASEAGWKNEPFSGIIEDGFLWGRGALDMKGGLAMMLSAFATFSITSPPPGDIILAIVSDEEAGGHDGAGFLVDNHASYFTEVKHALSEFGGFSLNVGGQRFLPVQVAEKRTTTITVTFDGTGGHSALYAEKEVIGHAMNFILRLQSSKRAINIDPVAKEMITQMADALGSKGLLLKLLLNPIIAPAILRLYGKKLASIFEPLIRTTVQVTGISTPNTTSNVIPSSVTVRLNARLLPSENGDEFISWLRQITGPKAEIKSDIPVIGPEGYDNTQFRLIKDITATLDPDITVIPMLLPGSTDARHFARIGIQTYGFLPMILPERFSFLPLVHGVNERIPVSVLTQGANSLTSFIRKYYG